MKWMAYGPNALLIYFAERVGDDAFQKGRAIASEIERRPPEGLTEFVPSFTSVLLEFDPAVVPDPKRRALECLALIKSALTAPSPQPVIKSIPVHYDGLDLKRVSERARLTVDQVIAIHAQTIYKVYALGFSPGFPYLGDLDPRLHTPRLSSPRPRVPAGSVAIGGEHTGIYPTDSPGGWNLIGRTPRLLFDPNRAKASGRDMDAFLLHPGDQVQFLAT